MSTIIGLNGLKSSGKDTAGTYLVEKYGFARLSFAAKLKESAAAALGITDPAVLEEWKNNPDARVKVVVDGVTVVDISVREFLQYYGTEAHRNIFGEDFWRKVMWAALPEDDGNQRYVITDARFPDELADVMRKDGYNVRVLRDQVENTGDGHASEAVPDSSLIDYWMRNHTTYEDLYAQLDTLMRGLGCAPLEGVVVSDGASVEYSGLTSFGEKAST